MHYLCHRSEIPKVTKLAELLANNKQPRKDSAFPTSFPVLCSSTSNLYPSIGIYLKDPSQQLSELSFGQRFPEYKNPLYNALWGLEATKNSSNSQGGKAVLKTEAFGRGAVLTRGLHSFSVSRKVLEHPQLCATGVKQSEEKFKFGAGVGSQTRAKEQVYGSPTWDESRERKRKSRKAGGTRAAAGPRVSSRLEHLQRGVVLRKGGSGEQPTHRPPPDHRLPPWGPGCR